MEIFWIYIDYIVKDELKLPFEKENYDKLE